MSLLPSAIYQQYQEAKHLISDKEQLLVLQRFDELSKTINQSFSRFPHCFKIKKQQRGIYLWGNVGVGKTFLMDCFFESIDTAKKRRIHFHAFMQSIHLQLKEHSGTVNPLATIIKALSRDIKLLCLDEFIVTDIVDAMLLRGLLQAIWDAGIYFVTTSNVAPHDLYKEGLRRDNFLPAIALLEDNLDIISMSSTTDYRWHYLSASDVYYTPLNKDADVRMHVLFQSYVVGTVSTEPLSLLGYDLPVIKACQTAIWFHFDVLCGPMRCQKDYLALTKKYDLIFLSAVPILTHRSANEVIRFIQLIDIFYDARIKCIISAESSPLALYTEGALLFEFQRTASRLMEMQSVEYLSGIKR